MTSSATLLLHCSGCADERAFVQPDCVDGHGADCPEWLCLDCGDAIVLGVFHPADPQPELLGQLPVAV